MRKNSDFKNISYVNYEMISMIVTLLSCVFISYSPIRIITRCGSASVIGILFLCFIAYILYFFIIRGIFKNEYDFFDVIKQTYPPLLQKFFGIVLYICLIIYTYLVVSNLLYNLRASIYSKSTIFAIAIFFIIAINMLAKRGFNVHFRIVGYISYFIVFYLIFIFIMSLQKMDLNNFLPILGNGPVDVFGGNLFSLGIFAPLILFTFFGGNVANGKIRAVYKNYNITMFVFSACYTLLIFTFIATVPVELTEAKYTLLLDLSSLVSLSPLSLKLVPIMIFVFSLILFISSSFFVLSALYNIERLNVVKDYSKFILPTVLILVILFLIPLPLYIFNKLYNVMYIIAISVSFGFPIITLILYYIKTKGGRKKFANGKNLEEYVEEVN